MPLRSENIIKMRAATDSWKMYAVSSFRARNGISVLQDGQRICGLPIYEEQARATSSSPSYNLHAHFAVVAAADWQIISGRGFNEAEPLNQLSSHNIYSIIAAGLILRDRGLDPESDAFVAQLPEVLTMIEQLKGSKSDAPEFKKAKGGVFAQRIDRLIRISGSTISFNSPTMIGLDTLLKIAMANSFCVPACNVNNTEMVEAATVAAALTRAPIIMEWTPGAFQYHGGAVAASIMTRLEPLKAMAAGLGFPFVCHLDHGTRDAVTEALNAGFTSVMYDPTETGKKEVPFADNLRLSKEMAGMAHDRDVAIELEIGGPKGSFADLSKVPQAEWIGYMTDPAQAVDFVGQTGADVLAVSIGNSHGGLKFPGGINVDHMLRIREKLDGAGFRHVPLVFHGGSDRSPFTDAISQLMGRPYKKDPSGTPVDLQVRAVREGRVAKLNLDTIFRFAQAYGLLVMRPVMDEYILNKGTDDFMAHVGIPWRVALINEFMRKLIELGAAGQAMTVFRQVALENAIAAIAKEVNVDPEQIKPDTSIENSGADSLGSVELESALDLPTGFIKKTTTVNDIADRMAAQLAGQKTASESKAGGDIE